MKALCSFLLTFFIAGNTIAQSNLIGVKFAAARTDISSNIVNNTTNRDGIFTGLTYEHISAGHFCIGIEALYEQRGYRVPYSTNHSEYVSFNCDYYSLPIRIGYVLGNKLFVMISAGALPAILQNAIVRSPNYDFNGNFVDYTEQEITDNLNSFDFAAFGDAGIGFNFGKISLGATYRYQHSFTSFADSGSGYYNRHEGNSISLSLKYILSKASN